MAEYNPVSAYLQDPEGFFRATGYGYTPAGSSFMPVPFGAGQDYAPVLVSDIMRELERQSSAREATTVGARTQMHESLSRDPYLNPQYKPLEYAAQRLRPDVIQKALQLQLGVPQFFGSQEEGILPKQQAEQKLEETKIAPQMEAALTGRLKQPGETQKDIAAAGAFDRGKMEMLLTARAAVVKEARNAVSDAFLTGFVKDPKTGQQVAGPELLQAIKTYQDANARYNELEDQVFGIRSGKAAPEVSPEKPRMTAQDLEKQKAEQAPERQKQASESMPNYLSRIHPPGEAIQRGKYLIINGRVWRPTSDGKSWQPTSEYRQ